LDVKGWVAVKTLCLYDESMSLLNVRLTAADEDAVRVLKGAGVELSSVIRGALRREAERLRARTPQKTAALIDEIFQEHPEPEHPPTRSFDVRDRRAFAAAMRAHLSDKRSSQRRRR
jgi:hypothetical protein